MNDSQHDPALAIAQTEAFGHWLGITTKLAQKCGPWINNHHDTASALDATYTATFYHWQATHRANEQKAYAPSDIHVLSAEIARRYNDAIARNDDFEALCYARQMVTIALSSGVSTPRADGRVSAAWYPMTEVIAQAIRANAEEGEVAVSDQGPPGLDDDLAWAKIGDPDADLLDQIFKRGDIKYLDAKGKLRSFRLVAQNMEFDNKSNKTVTKYTVQDNGKKREGVSRGDMLEMYWKAVTQMS